MLWGSLGFVFFWGGLLGGCFGLLNLQVPAGCRSHLLRQALKVHPAQTQKLKDFLACFAGGYKKRPSARLRRLRRRSLEEVPRNRRKHCSGSLKKSFDLFQASGFPWARSQRLHMARFWLNQFLLFWLAKQMEAVNLRRAHGQPLTRAVPAGDDEQPQGAEPRRFGLYISQFELAHRSVLNKYSALTSELGGIATGCNRFCPGNSRNDPMASRLFPRPKMRYEAQLGEGSCDYFNLWHSHTGNQHSYGSSYRRVPLHIHKCANRYIVTILHIYTYMCLCMRAYVFMYLFISPSSFGMAAPVTHVALQRGFWVSRACK